MIGIRAAILFALALSMGGMAAASSLPAFKSESELAAYLKRVKKERPKYVAVTALESGSDDLQTVVVTGVRASLAAEPGITNIQEAGVDEGDIVKRHGDFLVVLRRGRLFTISVKGGSLKPNDAVDAYPPGVNAQDDWYDEMLIAGNTVAVIGYSYGRGGTEINRFTIDDTGHLQFLDAYQLRSDDYFSSRNYASRLIGHALVFYSPYGLYHVGHPAEALPGLRRWNGKGKEPAFERISGVRAIYRSPGLPMDAIDTLHTVTSCDLTAPDMTCKAISLFGPASRVFYVSSHNVYVWTSVYWPKDKRGKRPESVLYRLPLDGGAPAAVMVRGSPTDQFSFREDGALGVLDVLVMSAGEGDAMWASDFSGGTVSLLRLERSDFSDGRREAPHARYRMLPSPKAERFAFHNRFVGDYVLYGYGQDWFSGSTEPSPLVAVPLAGGAPSIFELSHGIDRIEAMGRDALVVGSDKHDTYFSSVLLAARAPALGDRYVQKGAAQSETRSHGFFFLPENDKGDGMLGLPIARPAREGFRQLFEDSAAIVFLRRKAGKFLPLGELASHPEKAVGDACVASCADWYGNARPIFLGGRVLALMGYELVEGVLDGERLVERARADFTPKLAPKSSAPTP